MPEMLRFFGRTFTVDAQVERACDTVNYSGVRRVRNTVLLDDLRCDGSGHEGCQALCRLYWKEAWLRPASAGAKQPDLSADEAYAQLARLAAESVQGTTSTPEEPTFRCQATELLRASEAVGWWSPRSFTHEVTGGNVGLWRFVRVMARVVLEEIGRRLRLIPRTSLSFPQSEMTGRTTAAPPARGLEPGQLVRIRSGSEISRTLDETGKARGLWFDREMKVYCGRTARVKTKVERFIDEGSGRMINLKSDAYILDGVVCESYRSDGRWLCPRAIYSWWREAWLEPLDGEGANPRPGHVAEPIQPERDGERSAEDSRAQSAG
jgi:hypothetical protein